MFIRIRSSNISGNIPGSLANGELALNYADQLLYYRHANGSIITLANGTTIGVDDYARVRANAAYDRANATAIVAQVSSNIKQVPANTTAAAVSFEIQNSLIGVSSSIGNTRFTISSNGTYLIVVEGQASRNAGGGNYHYADCWVKKNGTNVAGSTARIPLPSMNIPGSLLNHVPISLATNDFIEIVFAADQAGIGVGLTPYTALAGGPSIPSVSMTVIKFFG